MCERSQLTAKNHAWYVQAHKQPLVVQACQTTTNKLNMFKPDRYHWLTYKLEACIAYYAFCKSNYN